MNKLELFQSTVGYRYSIDSFILADFVSPSKGDRVMDFGTGNGIVPLLLARKTRAKITGLEIQGSLLRYARHNISQNGIGKNITLIQGDIRLSKLFFKGGSFNIIVSNPPYRKLNSGRLNPNSEKAIARHEILITLPEIIENAKNLLCDSGKLVMIYLPERYDELINTMEHGGLIPKKIRFVYSNRKSEPKMFLIEGVKSPQYKGEGNGNLVLDPLYIYDNKENYTLEMQRIYDSFNNHCRANGNRKIKESGSSSKEA